MRVILSEAKDLAYGAWGTHTSKRDQPRLSEVPRRLRGSG